MRATHYYALRPGRCRYLGSNINPDTDQDPYRSQLQEGEELRVFPTQEQDAAHKEALAQARTLISPEDLQWRSGARIREIRTAQGLLQEDISQATGLTVNWLSRIENDLVHNPEYVSLQRLALALGVEVRDLV
jgi:ribosome-binding protein aMBF1 (putative translation factor)